jgi:L-threonylcarbamoyladenylate synthase
VTENTAAEGAIRQAIELLKSGGIVAYPTDTVYGLGASPLNESAVGRIYEAKKRPHDQPLPLLLADKSDLLKIARVIPAVTWKLAERFLPGGLTLVLLKSRWVPDTVTAGSDSIAVRIPDHPVPLALIQGLGTPIVGTSANLSGQPSPRTAADVHKQLGEKVDLIIDGGECPEGIDSTILDLCGPTPSIIREGAVSRAEIAEICRSLLQ